MPSHVWFFATPWAVAHQTPLSLGFSRQEQWSGLPCPPPGEHPDPGMQPESPASPALQVDSLLLSHQGSPNTVVTGALMKKNGIWENSDKSEYISHMKLRGKFFFFNYNFFFFTMFC